MSGLTRRLAEWNPAQLFLATPGENLRPLPLPSGWWKRHGKADLYQVYPEFHSVSSCDGLGSSMWTNDSSLWADFEKFPARFFSCSDPDTDHDDEEYDQQDDANDLCAHE